MADTDPERTTRRVLAHERNAERYERAAAYWDEHGDHEQAEVERANARMEREQAELIAHPKQKTRPKKGDPVEIPIPTREAFLRDLDKVAPPTGPLSHDSRGEA